MGTGTGSGTGATGSDAGGLSLSLMMRRPYPELAAALRARAEVVMQRWQAAVREALPAADELTFNQLRDDMPEVLEQISVALDAERLTPFHDLTAMSSAHGSVRFHQTFSLNELMAEFDLLRPVVIEEVMRQLDRRIEVEEVIVLNAAMDFALRRSVLAFVAHQHSRLQAATEAQSKYLSFLSHDLRGGLNGVFLMIEVLKRELAADARYAESVQDLDMMRRSIFETIATMDRFLHAERFRKGKVQVKPQRVVLKHLASDVAAQFAYQAKDKGVELKAEPADGCDVVTDKELVTLILQNLLANAIKYGRRGSVTVSSSPTDDGGCRLSVADEGPGIERDKLNQLFSPYTRGDNTYGQPGVGLGLSIARQAADLLGAKLWAESEVGRGSTFFVELPKEVK